MFAVLEFTTFERPLSATSRRSGSEYQLSIESDPVRTLFRYPEVGVDWKADKLLDVTSGFVTLHCLSNEIATAGNCTQPQRCAVFESVCEIGMLGELGNELTVNVAMCSVRPPAAGSLAKLVFFLLALPESVATRNACARRLAEVLRLLDSRFADLTELRAALTDTSSGEADSDVQPSRASARVQSSAFKTFRGLVERVREYELAFEEVVVPSDARKTFDALINDHIAAAAVSVNSQGDSSKSLFGALVFCDRRLLHNHGVANETLYAVWRTLRLDSALQTHATARTAGELLRMPLYLDRTQLTERGQSTNPRLSFSRSTKVRFSLLLCMLGKLELCCLFVGDGEPLEPITVNAIRRATFLFDAYLKEIDSPS